MSISPNTPTLLPSTPSELSVEFLSILALNSWCSYNSAMRMQMFSSHLTQFLIIDGCTEHRFQTGMEVEFGKYTLGVRMPVNGRILRVIDRYPKTITEDQIRFNPETLVIYEDDATGEVGCFNIPYYRS